MMILAVHPSSLMYSKIFLRLEPLGIELIAVTDENPPENQLEQLIVDAVTTARERWRMSRP